MKRNLTLFSMLLLSASLFSQTADFENFNLSTGIFLNGSDGSGGFVSAGVYFPNDYNDAWGSWTGWAVSTMTDTTTPGFTNQYSAIAGTGADGTDTYGVTFVLGSSRLELPSGAFTVQSVMITNNTYAYLSMRDGDGFAKKFGGADGNDPDFFLLTIKGYNNGVLLEDSVDFYLADYRFADNAQDYIVDNWTSVDLSIFGEVDSLIFSLSSSDMGQFGINTPTYFCLDELRISPVSNTDDILHNVEIRLFPNPTTTELSIDWQEQQAAQVTVYHASGQRIHHATLQPGQQSIDVSNWPTGKYWLKIQTEDGWTSRAFIKQ